MDNRTEVREFLASRRARITPEAAGLPFYGGNRRVPGLRREEVAMLARMSVDYYTRLERGNLSGVSDAVLQALARALQLDEAEKGHLFDLAKTANASSQATPTAAQRCVRPSVQFMLDALTGAPALVRNGRMDILAANQLAVALYSQMFASSARPPNHSRFIFLDPKALEFYPQWDLAADNNIEILRAESGRSPHDQGLANLVGELSLRSEEFRARWAAHNVRRCLSGTNRFHHPIVGDIHLRFEALELAEDPGLTMAVYPAEPGSESEDSLRLLASWAATQPHLKRVHITPGESR